MKMADSYEKIPLEIFPDAQTGSSFVARKVATLIREKESRKERCVLGLSTGKSPLKLYAELIRMHKEEGLSFKHVLAFNLDEYYPIRRSAPQSYYRFMKENLFACGPNKILRTVNALDCAVLILIFGISFQLVGCFRL